MKPIKLTMKAFGPYASVQEIDFRELGGRSFFLIHGATGAGKTTILDAICFALYGQTSGNDRKGEQMRSQHTKSDIPTVVVFDFALGDNVYRVMRSLKRERAKGIDADVSFKSDRAVLWNRTDIKDEQGTGVEIASKWTKVMDEIEALFGFESAQFRQVIMLPQDKFQQLLKAKSDERENLFKVLFQTKQFEDIEEGLKQEAAALEKELQRLAADRAHVLQIAQASTPNELGEKREEAFVALEAKRNELTALRARERQAADQFTYGHDIHNKIVEREQAEAHLRDIELRKAEHADKRNKVDRARRAAELVELENAMLQQQGDAEVTEKKRQDAHINYEKAIESHRLATEALARELGRQSERDEARRKRDRLDSLQGQVGELDRARKEFKDAQKQAADAECIRDTVRGQRDELQKRLGQLEQALANAEAIALQLVSAQQAETHAQQIYGQWMKLRDIAGRWKAAQKKEDEVEKQLQQVARQLSGARDRRDRLEDAWREGQAAILAQQLADNTPCPVCGSIHHPRPATSTQTPPSDADLKSARTAVESLEAESQKARNELTKHHDDTVRFDAERKPLVELLGEKAHLSLFQINSEIEGARAALRIALDESERIETLKQQVALLKVQLMQAEAGLVDAEHTCQVAEAQQAAKKAVLDERQSKVPLELDDPRKLESAKRKADAMIKVLEDALEKVQANVSQANQNLASCQAIREQISEQAAIAKRRAEEQHLQFSERVKTSGFADVSDYDQAKVAPQTITDLDEEIRKYEGQLRAANERMERARQAARSLIKPDLEKLRAEHQQAKENVESAVRSEEQLQSRLNSFDECLKHLEQIEREFGQKEREYSVVGKIAAIANGENPYKMTFHRFVLSALLEDILGDATQQLQIMSRGRYLLQRAESPLKGRRIGGLDLVVSDTWTGNSRPVETLSGGESFYTSLALALGLREVVQAYAGGIRLDTIFIDEGFGSLDSDTLDLAIRTLENLKQGGRLVGIISHVESLRERIPTRLEVVASANGSAARFVIGGA